MLTKKQYTALKLLQQGSEKNAEISDDQLQDLLKNEYIKIEVYYCFLGSLQDFSETPNFPAAKYTVTPKGNDALNAFDDYTQKKIDQKADHKWNIQWQWIMLFSGFMLGIIADHITEILSFLLNILQ